MAKNVSKNFLFLVYFFKLVLSVYCGDLSSSPSSSSSSSLVPCYFIFGDSLVDNGNNNDRNTLAKANYPPYGIDYPSGPTGRFTNGRNVADVVAELLGFTDHIPPFASASGDTILNGVNYASGGAGILDRTGKQFGDVISLNEQLQNHQTTINATTTVLGDFDSTMKHLSQCIYSVGMGSNDYAAYALMPTYTPEQYASLLIDQYSTQLRELYKLGARKVALFGLGPIGCVPAALSGTIIGNTCVSTTNIAVGSFNAKLKSLVDVLNKDLTGAKFIYVDTFGITVSDPATNGFKYSNIPCCAVSGVGMCNFQGVTCNNRSDFAYFDGFHPTDASAVILGRRAFRAESPSDAYPIDIQQLSAQPQ